MAFSRRLLAPLLGATLFTAFCSAPVAAQSGTSATRQTVGIGVGQFAPDFRVALSNGSTLALSQLRGRMVVLNFFATWCPSCRVELPYLERLQKRYPTDTVVLAIGGGHSMAEMKSLVATNRLTLRVGADPSHAISRVWVERSIPRTFVIGPNGQVLQEFTGFSPNEIARTERLIIVGQDTIQRARATAPKTAKKTISITKSKSKVAPKTAKNTTNSKPTSAKLPQKPNVPGAAVYVLEDDGPRRVQ